MTEALKLRSHIFIMWSSQLFSFMHESINLASRFVLIEAASFLQLLAKLYERSFLIIS